VENDNNTGFKVKMRYPRITFRQRQGGVNSINMKHIFKIGKNAVSGFILLREVVKRCPVKS
jgi:hypothetical protein